jgi:hypothetical protein
MAEPSGWDRYSSTFPAPTPGQLLYERWCGSNRSDRARYYARMNPAEKAAWEDLATELRERLSDDDWQALIHNIKEYR